MISRRSAMKGGLVTVSTAAAYCVAQSSLLITEAAAQQQPQYNLFVKGSSNFYGVSVGIYSPDVELQYMDREDTSLDEFEAEELIGRLLSYSRLRGGRFPQVQGREVERELGKSQVILSQPIYDGQTTRDLLEQASTVNELFWAKENPWFLAGTIRNGLLIIAPLAVGFLEEMGSYIAQEFAPYAKAWFLELINDEQEC